MSATTLTTSRQTAAELAAEIVDTLEAVRLTDGIPVSTQLRCEHSRNSVHESLHGLALWLRELLEWAPLDPRVRGKVAGLARSIDAADASFHAVER